MNKNIKELRFETDTAVKYFSKIMAYTTGPAELKTLLEDGNVKLIDVRRKEDYDISHIPGAISIPKDELVDNFDKLSQEEVSIVYCYNQQCHLGVKACLILAEYGYPTMHMDGGFKVWKEDFRFATIDA